MPRRAVVLVIAVALLGAVAAITATDEDLPRDLPTVPAQRGATDSNEGVPDPFAWHPDRAEELAARAASGTAHPLYTRSPGGAVATAVRTARWRPQIERAAEQAGVDPDRLEGLVFLESAGRPDAIAGGNIEGAVGLTQILAETGQNLLGMRVDVARSRRLTRRIARDERRGRASRVARLERERRRVDERFDPAKALAATARYLTMARERFGREDLAFVSYHMGMGNLEGVLRAYTVRADADIADVVDEEDLTWARVYFDSTPSSHPESYVKLRGFGDDSSNYYWKVEAARTIMRLHRDDPERLTQLAGLHAAKASAEEVLHPPGSTPQFATPHDLMDAWDRGETVAFPNDPVATGLARDSSMGELARRLDVPAGLYRGLRPEALALALYIGAQVRAQAPRGALTVTSTVRDQRYQDLLVGRNREATKGYSLHTTGWAFDVLRTYSSRAQALAFQFVLDRLQVLDVISWVREPAAIHITVSRDAKALLPLLDRLKDSS